MLRYLLLALLLALQGVAVLAHAEPATHQAARDGLLRLLPEARIDSIGESPLPGMLQLMVGTRVFYASEDGRYVLEGRIIDTVERKNVTARAQGEVRKQALQDYPADQMISFIPQNPRYVVTVFTDIDCPYCREMHSRIREYHLLGIGIRYLLWPRAGLGSPAHQKAISVWCADDRETALSEAKAGYNPPPRDCENPIAEQFQMGIELGVDSTPNVITSEGILIRGYAPPDELLMRLESIQSASVPETGESKDPPSRSLE